MQKIQESKNSSGPTSRHLAPWRRFVNLRSYGRTHLAVSWRLQDDPVGCQGGEKAACSCQESVR